MARKQTPKKQVPKTKVTTKSRNVSHETKKTNTNIKNVPTPKGKKKKDIKVISDKKALRSLRAYEKAKAKKQETTSRTVEEFKKNISKYYNKDGSLKKSALRTDKAKREYNRLIKEFNQSAYSSQASRKRITNKIIKTSIERGLYDKEQAKNVISAFTSDSIQYLYDKGRLTSDQIQALGKDHNTLYDFDNIIEKVAKELKERVDFDTPNEMKGKLHEDDFYRVINDTLILIKDSQVNNNGAYDLNEIIEEVLESYD